MWSVASHAAGPGTLRWSLRTAARRALSFEDVVHAWRSDPSFREFWMASLRGVRFDAYCWECPPLRPPSGDSRFECVFISSPSLARMAPEPEAFAAHFQPQREIAVFANLGADAVLVAPRPAGADRDYRHLAAFVRSAPESQQQALWQAVGEAMASRVGADPVWLSTAGHGVGWLHVRLDSRPKYYQHAPYT